MHALNDTLSDLARAIVRGESPSPLIAANYPLPNPLPLAGEGNKTSLREFRMNYSVDVAIEVYRNNYRGNLHDTLAGAYPVIAQLVGKDFFRLLARHYIEQHLSRSGNLHHYGAEMAEFVAGFEPAQGLAYLPDVAALEWACHCAYFSDDAATPDIHRLAQVPPEQYVDLMLHIHPSCHLVRSRYPVATIWRAHQPCTGSDFHIDIDSGSCNALVSRKHDAVLVNELSAADADWLQSLQDGSPLGEATAVTQEHHPDFNLQAALLNLVALDVLSGFSVGATP
jgi:hypothetical protein